MDILREKIIAAVNGAGFYSDENDFYTDAELAADAILAIPELKEALETKRRLLELLREAESEAYLSAIVDNERRD